MLLLKGRSKLDSRHLALGGNAYEEERGCLTYIASWAIRVASATREPFKAEHVSESEEEIQTPCFLNPGHLLPFVFWPHHTIASIALAIPARSHKLSMRELARQSPSDPARSFQKPSSSGRLVGAWTWKEHSRNRSVQPLRSSTSCVFTHSLRPGHNKPAPVCLFSTITTPSTNPGDPLPVHGIMH